jgi:Ca2+-binding RTX toxin-like protein
MAIPSVSLQTITGTFDGADGASDAILASQLVESLGEQEGAAVLSLVLSVEGEIPADGLEVVIESDRDFSEYFANLGRQPFGLGGEVLEAVYDSDGNPAGIKALVTSANALFTFTVADQESETDGTETLTFSLAPSSSYTINSAAESSTISFYDTLADVPDLGAGPQIGLTIDNTALIEAEGTELTLTFNVEGTIPDDGVLVYVDSGTRGAVGELNVFQAEVSGGVFPAANFASSGFYFKIFEDGASIKLPVFDETTNPEIDPADALEGIESFTFSLVESPGYSIDPAAAAITYTIADTADSLPLVSLSTSPEVLVESEGTVSVHTFTVSTTPPAEGITVMVSAPNLSEFNLAQIAATGGEILGVNAAGTGFEFKITEQNATIELPIAADGIAEDTEEATFTLEPGTGYLVSATANSGTFLLSDTPIVAPPTDAESNDTIATAVATGLSADNNSIAIAGTIDQQREPAIDRTEDVDMYSVELAVGDVLRLDTDARLLLPSPQSPDTILRLFDAAGNQLAQSTNDYAPDELFGPGRQDSYLEYTATSAGTVYVGVSSNPNGIIEDLENNPYDPNQAGSGTGRSYGEYTLNLSLNQSATPSPTVIAPSTGSGPTVTISSTPGTYDGDDNLISSALVQSVGEDDASIFTIGFNVDGDVPEEGIEVILNSDIDLTTVFSPNQPFAQGGAEVLGAVYDEAGIATGLRVLLTSNASIINLSLENSEVAPTDGPEALNFSLTPSAGYVVGAESTASATVYDTLAEVPALPNVPTVSVSVSETALVESTGNLTTLTFTLDSPPPAEGLSIAVSSNIRAALGEFDVFNAEVTGGSFPSPNGDASGFFFRVTEQTATITLSAFDETTNPQIPPETALEGIEEFTFAIQPGVGYAVSPTAGAFTLTIADNPDSVVITPPGDGDGEDPALPFETEFNDTLADAIDTELSPDNLSFKMEAQINSIPATRNLIDATEDVDMFSFELEAGDTITIDIDSIPYEIEDIEGEQRVDTELRIFNAAGEELLLNTQAPAPGELFQSGRDPYVEFTATESGTYTAGVALLGNRAYDPNVAGSGSGRVAPENGINVGEYTLEANLIVGDAGTDDTLVGGANNDTLEGFRGNDTLAGGLGDDVILGGSGDDVLRGDENSRNPQNGIGGDDIIFGGSGSDRIGGKAGNDILSGDAGDDFIWGDDGDDIIIGGTGNDTLVGDNMSGGSGSDLFVFGTGDGTDTILDFEVGSDRIGLITDELAFADLTITQEGSNTVLGVTSTGEQLAVLNGIQASTLSESSFEAVADITDPTQALAVMT